MYKRQIIDTAGLRDTNDEVEKIGIARTYRALENAQVALLLVDAAHGIDAVSYTHLDVYKRQVLSTTSIFKGLIQVLNCCADSSCSKRLRQVDQKFSIGCPKPLVIIVNSMILL